LFNEYTGITTNQAEGMNNLIKALTDRKELSLDMICLSLYQLTIHYCNSIKRGMCNEGDYVLKALYKDCRMNSSAINFRDSISPSEIIQNLAKSVHLGNIEEFIVSDSDSSISGSSSRKSIASSWHGSQADTRNNSFSSDLNSSIVLLPSDTIDRDIVDNLTNLNLDKQTDDSQKYSTLIERIDGVDDIDKSLNEADASFGESEPVPDPVPEPIETLPSSSIQPLEPKTIVPKKNGIIELALSYKKYVKLITDLGIYQVFDDRKVCFQVTPNKTGEKTTYKCSCNFAKTCVHIMAVEAANGRNLYEEIRYSKPKLDDLIRFRHDNKLSGRKMSGHVKNTTSLSKPDS
jgi:hypothetical protein